MRDFPIHTTPWKMIQNEGSLRYLTWSLPHETSGRRKKRTLRKTAETSALQVVQPCIQSESSGSAAAWQLHRPSWPPVLIRRKGSPASAASAAQHHLSGHRCDDVLLGWRHPREAPHLLGFPGLFPFNFNQFWEHWSIICQSMTVDTCWHFVWCGATTYNSKTLNLYVCCIVEQPH